MGKVTLTLASSLTTGIPRLRTVHDFSPAIGVHVSIYTLTESIFGQRGLEAITQPIGFRLAPQLLPPS